MFKYNHKTSFPYNMYCVCYAKYANIRQHYLSKQYSTQTGWYTIAACFPFEHMKT